MKIVFRRIVVLLFCSCLAASMAGTNEGWIAKSPLNSPFILEPAPFSHAATVSPPQLATPSGFQALASPLQVSGDVAELAAALEYDPVKICEFVRNHIEYDLQYGWMRTPERTLLDGMGTDADQSVLLVELLQASGYASAQYVKGFLAYPQSGNGGYNLESWLGTLSLNNSGWLLNQAGYSVYEYSTNSIEVYRYWVLCDIGGTTYELDPVFTRHADYSGADITALSGYSRSNLLANAGGVVVGNNEVSLLDEETLREYLGSLSDTMADSIRSGYPNASVMDVLGGRSLVPEFGLCTNRALHTSQPVAFTQLPVELDHGFYFSYMDAQGGDAYQYFGTLSLGCGELSIVMDSSGTNGTILLDGASLFSGNLSPYGQIRIYTVQPYTYYSGGIQHSTYLDDRVYNLNAGSTNAFVYALGNSDHGGMVRKHSESLRDSIVNGNSSASALSALHAVGDVWMSQQAMVRRLAVRVSNGGRLEMDYALGQFAADANGDFVDIKHLHSTVLAGDTNTMESLKTASGMLASALEHGVLEQTQPGLRDAVSTIDVLTLASRNGQALYRATSNNFNTVKTNLTNYLPGELAKIQEHIDSGDTVILHEDGDTALNAWEGLAFIASGDEDHYTISGNLYGGHSTEYDPFDPNAYYKLLIAHLLDPANTPHPKSKEPVDMATGAYLFDHDDLAMGGPLPLRLSRHYNSQSRSHDSGMGFGWKHSFNLSVDRHTDYASMLGGRSPEDVAALAIALYAIQDLAVDEDTAKGWMTSVLTTKWAMDQLTHHAVTIATGQNSMTFIEQPDGSFTPPPGMAVSLSETNNAFTMQERHGNTYAFNTNGLIETLSDPDGNTLLFNYTGGTNLNFVESSFGPKFTFGYTGDLLTSVSDNSTPSRSVSYEYDSSNNLTNFADAVGKDWGTTYDDDHKIKTLIDPEDIMTISNNYNSVGQVTNQVSATGNPWNFYFTGTRNVEEDSYGNQTAYHLDRQQRTWSVEKADGTRIYIFQDGQNHITNAVNEAGVTNIMVYDVDHNLLAQTNAVGTSEQVALAFGYDSEHHLRFSTNAVGTTEQVITEYTYTPTHHIDVITEAKGSAVERATDLDYFGNGLLQQRSEGNGQRITSYTYDGNGNPDTLASTDAGTIDTLYDIRGDLRKIELDGKTTTYSYDARRQPTGALYEDGTTTSQTYWDNGLLKQMTDARGQTTDYFWTPAYKPAGVILPNTGSTTNLYDDADRLVYARDTQGNWVTNILDSVGRIVEATSSSLTVTNQFDAVGNLTNSIVDPSGLNLWTSSTYDSLNRIESVESAQSVDSFQYDPLNRITNRVDSASKNWKTEFDELGRVKKTIRPSGNYEEYGFDDLGNRTHFWNAEFKPMIFGVDAQGRVTSITNAINKVTSFTFDAAGNLFSRKDAKNAETFYGYDSLNRLTSITNEGVEVATFNHDANGNLVEQTFQSAQATFGYDEMNRLFSSTSSVASVTSVVDYSYDLNGNRTNIVYPGGLTVGYKFGVDNRLESVTTKYLANTKTISFGYDTANRLDGISYPNGVNSTFGHDAEGRITSIQHGSFVDRTIQRNALGFKTTELIDAGIKPTAPETARRIKKHNNADQLISEQVQTDVTNWVDIAYSYSDNGCLTSSVSSAESVDYSYDYDNRLTGASTDYTDFTDYLYDASGARVGRIHNSATNYFIIDYTDGLKRPLAETDSSGAVTRYYVWAGMRLLCHIEANGDVRYYHSDELGSTLALTKEDGAVTDEFAYMPYGYATHTPHANSSATPFQWLGGYGVYYDVDTELHLTLHRAYSSKLKRFIHPDPLGIDGGVNVYMWANLNPLWFVDPYGLEGISGMGWLDKIQIGLDGAGLFPGLGIFPDALNTFISLGRGNLGGAGLNALAMIPLVGQGVTGGKLIKNGIKYSDEIAALGRNAPKNVGGMADDMAGWLGKDAKTITNKAGDKIFLSKDGARRIRFDIKRTSPHQNPHGHVEILKDGKWMKSGPVYPKDVPNM